MKMHRGEISLRSVGNRDMSDITVRVAAVVEESGIKTGICHVFNFGSTGIISTIEFEDGLKRDFPELLHKLAPPSFDYGHERAWGDGNGHSHLHSSLVGPETTIPVENGGLALGTWQQIFHYEADIKPRNRRIIVTVMGE